MLLTGFGLLLLLVLESLWLLEVVSSRVSFSRGRPLPLFGCLYLFFLAWMANTMRSQHTDEWQFPSDMQAKNRGNEKIKEKKTCNSFIELAVVKKG